MAIGKPRTLTPRGALIGSLDMSNVLSDEKKQQVIALRKLGWSLRRIEEATGVRRETASVYLKTAGVVVCLPGWGRRAPAKPAIQVTPDFIAPFSQKPDAPTAPSPPSAGICEEYRELIEQGLARGRNGKAIWQDLVSDHGFAGSYQAVKRFVRKLRGPQRPEAAGIILTAPGEEARVDYGSGPMVCDPKTGKYRQTRLFVLTLRYSRKAVRLLYYVDPALALHKTCSPAIYPRNSMHSTGDAAHRKRGTSDCVVQRESRFRKHRLARWPHIAVSIPIGQL